MLSREKALGHGPADAAILGRSAEVIALMHHGAPVQDHERGHIARGDPIGCYGGQGHGRKAQGRQQPPERTGREEAAEEGVRREV